MNLVGAVVSPNLVGAGDVGTVTIGLIFEKHCWMELNPTRKTKRVLRRDTVIMEGLRGFGVIFLPIVCFELKVRCDGA